MSEREIELDEAINLLRTLSDSDLRDFGFSVKNTFDEVDDPVLIGPDGMPVESWREGFENNQPDGIPASLVARIEQFYQLFDTSALARDRYRFDYQPDIGTRISDVISYRFAFVAV